MQNRQIATGKDVQERIRSASALAEIFAAFGNRAQM
jgi:hypothetical protein